MSVKHQKMCVMLMLTVPTLLEVTTVCARLATLEMEHFAKVILMEMHNQKSINYIHV